MRSMTEIVDHVAEEEPSRVWVKISRSAESVEDSDTTWQDITFRQLSHAVNTMAHWIDKHLNKSGSKIESEPLAYMGSNDIRYPIILLAALKTGHIVSHLLFVPPCFGLTSS